MSDRRTISVPGLVYRRAKAYAKASGLSLSGFVSDLIAADLTAAGVSEDEPGLPMYPRLRSHARRARGPRRSFSIQGLLYRRARAHAAALRLPLAAYVEGLVESGLELAGVDEGDPGPQPRGRGGRIAGSPSPPPSPDPGPLMLPPATSTPRPSPPRDPALVAADEDRCRQALDNAGLSSGGFFLL